MEVSKQDWKLFQDRIGEWQESWIEKINNEYIKILTDEGKASEKFWQLEKRIKEDKKHIGVLIELRKQDVPFDIVSLIKDEVIGFEDLEGFSDELRKAVRYMFDK
ncbi:MAG: multidrug transporter [Clostridia bacterium]|nr:multidrug transporter [Clostridia bacterium]